MIAVKRMKKFYFFNFVLICIIAVPSLVFARALCEDENPVFDILCNNNGFLRYDEFLAIGLSETGLLCSQYERIFPSRQIISYLERQEKSPPYYPAIL